MNVALTNRMSVPRRMLCLSFPSTGTASRNMSCGLRAVLPGGGSQDYTCGGDRARCAPRQSVKTGSGMTSSSVEHSG